MLKAAREGKVSELSYGDLRPGRAKPAATVTSFTRVGGQVGGVGCYA
jgi:hypothetical protein